MIVCVWETKWWFIWTLKLCVCCTFTLEGDLFAVIVLWSGVVIVAVTKEDCWLVVCGLCRFVINEEAIKALNKIEGNVGVISIAGLYRTGKSFVLNQLANQQRGFDVGSTVGEHAASRLNHPLKEIDPDFTIFLLSLSSEPCTEGIWIWIIDAKKAYPHLAPDNMTLVLLDTEVSPFLLANHSANGLNIWWPKSQGLGSYQKSTTHDVKVFSLSVLLSSYFVYNSIGTIDDSAMDKLSYPLQHFISFFLSFHFFSQDRLIP